MVPCPSSSDRPHALEPRAGIGLRAPHYAEFLDRRPAVALIEVHSENCFRGGRHLDVLLRARRDHAVSLHGVGLSLGSTDVLSTQHLAALKALVDRVEPALVSDHLCWSSVGGVYVNDLLPLPFTHEALLHVARRIEHAQEVLGRTILVENVSSYLQFRGAQMSEWDFLAELARLSGCGILLDINNVHVSACNHGFDARAYLAAMPAHAVREFHLAGHVANPVTLDDGRASQILIDTHNRPVCSSVWSLFEEAIQRVGPRPTIVEWDSDLPALQTLLDEAGQAECRLAAARCPQGERDVCAA
jgi:uncharacterized protein